MLNQTDVFLSHHTDSCGDIVEELANTLEASSVTAWYAKRGIPRGENYAKILPVAIGKCKLFVLLLNKFALASHQIEREINIAMNLMKPILIINLDNSPLDSLVYVSAADSQVVFIKEKNTSILTQKICLEIIEWFTDNKDYYDQLSGYSLTNYKFSWDVNNLDFFGDTGERERIKLQHRFIYKFAKDEYNELLSVHPEPIFLDVGCNTGLQSKMFLEGKAIKHYIGIDREQAALKEAKNTFPDGHFYLCDCESEEFNKVLSQIKEDIGISGFDIINISMLILHTKNPEILIDTLSSHLSETGQIIILDIDDGFNIAYPDHDGMFNKAIELCFKTEFSGYRHSGREINKILSDADFTDIKLHKIGLSSIGMSRTERDAFFDIYFWFILDDLKKMHEENPKDIFLEKDYNWLKSKYIIMKNNFKKKDFFFNLGFMLYSARF